MCHVCSYLSERLGYINVIWKFCLKSVHYLNDYVVVYVRLLDYVPRAEKLLTRQCPSWLSIIRSETWTGRYDGNVSVIHDLHVRIQRGGGTGGPDPPWKMTKI